jgi:hypothetical protein
LDESILNEASRTLLHEHPIQLGIGANWEIEENSENNFLERMNEIYCEGIRIMTTDEEDSTTIINQESQTDPAENIISPSTKRTHTVEYRNKRQEKRRLNKKEKQNQSKN